MISLINRYFVPVYVSNEDYHKDGSAPAEEKAERDRIYREALKAKLSAGSVHVYITAPDGHCIDSQHVATAAKVDQLTAMLERTVDKLKTPEGKPLVPPSVQSAPSKGEPGSLQLHLTARNLKLQDNNYLIPQVALGETRSGNWGAYPGENWIFLHPAELGKLLSSGESKPGTAWTMDRDVTAKILNYFYPSTENNDIRKNHIEHQSMQATVLSIQEGVARARLDGQLKMQHPFYHKDDANVVEATIVGYLDFEAETRKIRSLRMVTEKAVYGQRPFGVAVRSIP